MHGIRNWIPGSAFSLPGMTELIGRIPNKTPPAPLRIAAAPAVLF
jgi:hypothetical protein